MDTRKNFIHGAVILMAANIISKLLGAVFKIPLTYLLEEEGMAIFNTAFSVYVMILSFTTCGMPLAISRMVAGDLAKNKPGDVRKTICTACLVLGISGLLGSLLLWFGAEFFSLSMKDAKAFFSIRMIAPAVFFVAVGTVFKSYYQGKSNMTPTAVSQVIEAVIKLVAGYGLSVYYAKLSVEYTAAAAIFGVTVGELIATLILWLLWLPDRKRLSGYPSIRPTRTIISDMFSYAVPMLIASGVSSALSLADIAVIRNALTDIRFTPETAEAFLRQYASTTTHFDALLSELRISEAAARWLYGAYSGYALTVFHLPVGMLAALGTSILPIIAGALAVRNRERAGRAIFLCSKFSLLLCLPAAVILGRYSAELLHLLFRNTVSARLLSGLAPCLVFIVLSDLFITVQHASGRLIVPFLYSFLGDIIKLILGRFLIRCPELNLSGVVIAANISYFVVLFFNYLAVRRQFGLRLMSLLPKPLCSVGVMWLVLHLVDTPFHILFGNDILALLASLAVGGFSYLLVLIFSGTLTADEIHFFKKG